MNRNPSPEQRRNAETLFVIKDPTRIYSLDKVYGLLEEAQRRGMDLGANSPLEKLTVGELDAMLNPVKN
jgi:hypothetical protein